MEIWFLGKMDFFGTVCSLNWPVNGLSEGGGQARRVGIRGHRSRFSRISTLAYTGYLSLQPSPVAPNVIILGFR